MYDIILNMKPENNMELLELLEKLLSGPHNFSKKSSAWLELLDATEFIQIKVGPKERALYYISEIKNQVMCPTCEKEPTHLITTHDHYIGEKCCSKKCRSKKQVSTVSKINEKTGLTRAQEIGKKRNETLLAVDPKSGMSGFEKIAKKRIKTLSVVDPETGMSGFQKFSKKRNETLFTVDSDSGLTGYQKITQKRNETLLAVDPETGMTGYQKVGLKSKDTLSQIDPETGLSGHQKIGIKVKAALSEIDPETGMTGYQKAGLKSKDTLSKIDPETGLSRAQEIGLKTKDTLSKIDPETGLTGYQLNGLKSKDTVLAVNPETGMSRAQEIGLKSKDTLSQIDPDSGLTGHQLNGLKVKDTLLKIDPETGLSRAQEIGLKTKDTLSKIDPETGLTGFQLNGLKIKRSMLTVRPETGLTGYEQIALTKRIKTYEKIIKNSKEFTLITSETDFVNRRGFTISYSCNKCGAVRTSSYKYIMCFNCDANSVSVPEQEVFDFCMQFSTDIECSNRALIYPKEIDIYSEKYKLAIEFDGIYWHSSDSVVNEKKTYHLEKTEKCADQGIQLLHVFGNEWENPEKQAIWKSIIRNKFGRSNRIFARKCNIKAVDSKTSKLFLKTNHLQGSCPSSINYGLYYNDQLVSLMTFGKSRYNKKYKYELLRFCNIIDTSVTGGASRLFKHFIKNHAGSVISYADKRRSNGNLYKQLGFELSHETNPNYFYVDTTDSTVLHSRVKFQKHKLLELLEIFNKSKTESENMYNNGYRKIFDCGNYVYAFKR